jgi:hypothetical protein
MQRFTVMSGEERLSDVESLRLSQKPKARSQELLYA